MQFENVLYEIAAPGVAKVTLNRPESLNSFTFPMLSEMAQAFGQAKADPEVRVLVVTGAGRAFCAGADLRNASGELGFEATLKTYYRPMITALATLGKPSIAMVNGVAAGAGMSTTLACDFRVVAKNARFVTAFNKIALIPDAGMTYHLPRLVGLARAQEMILLNRDVTADEAVTLGLATMSVAGEELEATTMKLASQLSNSPTLAFSLTRQMLHGSFLRDLDEAMEQEEKNQEVAGTSQDFFEGLAAFMEKRQPSFKGK